MARRRVGAGLAMFAGATGMAAYIWSQQNPEQARHVVEEAKHVLDDAKHVAEDTKHALEEAAHSEQVQQMAAKTSELLEQAKVTKEHFVDQVKHTTDDFAHQAMEATEHLVEQVKTSTDQLKTTTEHFVAQTMSSVDDMKHKLDEKLTELVHTEGPNILDQLRHKTEGLLHPSAQEKTVVPAAALAKAPVSASTPSAASSTCCCNASPSKAAVDNSWAAPAAFLFWHLGVAAWHSSGRS